MLELQILASPLPLALTWPPGEFGSSGCSQGWVCVQLPQFHWLCGSKYQVTLGDTCRDVWVLGRFASQQEAADLTCVMPVGAGRGVCVRNVAKSCIQLNPSERNVVAESQ